MKKNIFTAVILSAGLFLSACDKSRVFEENKSIKDNQWKSSQPVVLQVNITDTINPHNVYLNIRNAGAYPFSNVFLFINTTLPGGQLDRDTAEILLATPEGKWMGSGLGDIWDHQVLFKKDVRFPQSGEYRFELSQAMRLDPLPGIMDAGIRIEKSK